MGLFHIVTGEREYINMCYLLMSLLIRQQNKEVKKISHSASRWFDFFYLSKNDWHLVLLMNVNGYLVLKYTCLYLLGKYVRPIKETKKDQK